MSVPVSQTGVPSLTKLELTPTLRTAAEKAFDNDAKQKEKPRELNPIEQLAVVARTAYVDGDGKLRPTGTAFDGANVFGHRTKVIQDLVRDNFQQLKTGYNKSTDSYTTLSWWDRHINGVTDDDITKGLALHQADAREHDPEYQAAFQQLTPKQKGNIDTLTSISSVLKQGKTNKDIKDLTAAIEKQVGGPEALATLRSASDKPITMSDLRIVQNTIAPQQQPYRSAEANIKASESQNDLNNETISASKAATALAARTEYNNNLLQQAEIEYKNDTNEYNWRTANADRDYKWRSEEADRDLKAIMTTMGYEDKRDERALSREDRRAENRQMLMLQLMKGLGNLGGAFAQ